MDDPASRSYWDARYEGAAYRFGETPNAFLEREAGRLRRGARIFAVADGEGRNGVWLARQGFDVLSTDISPVAVAKARDLASRHGATIDARVADLADWDWPVAEVDAVERVHCGVALAVDLDGVDGAGGGGAVGVGNGTGSVNGGQGGGHREVSSDS